MRNPDLKPDKAQSNRISPEKIASPGSEARQRLAASVDSLLDSWAIKYNVPTNRHDQYKQMMAEPLLALYSSVPHGNRPGWMDELEIAEQDTFSYVLRTAEEAYQTMHRTHRDLQVIKSYLQEPQTDRDLRHKVLQSLSQLGASLGNDLLTLNHRFKEKEHDIRSGK